MPLDDLLREIMEGKASGKKIKLLSDVERTGNYSASTRKKQPTRVKPLVVHGLGSKYSGAYFTQREAECMVLLLKGKTIDSVAALLKLSPRTIEYYIKNMKAKLGCRTKFELVDLVYASDFMHNVDF